MVVGLVWDIESQWHPISNTRYGVAVGSTVVEQGATVQATTYHSMVTGQAARESGAVAVTATSMGYMLVTSGLSNFLLQLVQYERSSPYLLIRIARYF